MPHVGVTPAYRMLVKCEKCGLPLLITGGHEQNEVMKRTVTLDLECVTLSDVTQLSPKAKIHFVITSLSSIKRK